MSDRRLSRQSIERGGFKENVGARACKPLANVLRAIRCRGRWAVGQQRRRIKTMGIGEPAEPPRGEAGEPPFNAEVAAKLRRFGYQQPYKFPADISVADKS
jgi:hypothetical protein